MINDNLIKGLDSKDIESLESVKIPLDQLSNHVRESIQGNLRESVEILIKKLKKNDEITGTDLQIIEKWIVGDAFGSYVEPVGGQIVNKLVVIVTIDILQCTLTCIPVQNDIVDIGRILRFFRYFY